MTREANLSEQSDSPAELTAGEMFESIRVLQLPPSDDWRRSVLPSERKVVSGWDTGWLVTHADTGAGGTVLGLERTGQLGVAEGDMPLIVHQSREHLRTTNHPSAA